MTGSDAFEKKLAFFKEHQNTPWSKLRHNIASANLKRHINSKALTILDAGGGNGLEAIALAQQGHKVVLLDYSAEMLGKPEQTCRITALSKLSSSTKVTCVLFHGSSPRQNLTLSFVITCCSMLIIWTRLSKPSVTRSKRVALSRLSASTDIPSHTAWSFRNLIYRRRMPLLTQTSSSAWYSVCR